MLRNGTILDLKIDGLGINGEGVARHQGFTVFVDGGLPSEEVTAKITLIKSSYGKGELVTLKRAAHDRIAPLCSRFKDCGGCHIMHLSYQSQLEQKTKLVKDQLKHIGGFHEPLVLPCLASPQPFFYRNKIQLPVGLVSGKVIMGFFRRGSHEIVPYERCLIHHPSMEETVIKIREFLSFANVVPYDESSRTGTLRHVIIRANSQGEKLIGLITTGQQKRAIFHLAHTIAHSLPNVVGVLESINKKVENTIFGEKAKLLFGTPFLVEKLDEISFKISLESFFQVNLPAAIILYDTALAYAEIEAESTVLDAYCGIGTLSLLAARKAKSVIGMECVSEAIADAKENARLNQIDNVEFVKGRVENHVELFRKIDCAFVNPPRKGLDPRVVQAILKDGPQRLVYISCNPATLARDLRMLAGAYQLIKVQPVDMFPQTMHVESIALLNRL